MNILHQFLQNEIQGYKRTTSLSNTPPSY